MKSLTLKLVIPLTIISFWGFTKWWFTLPEDAPDTMFTGFPFPYVCEGWYTSMSLQIFITEFVADWLLYFLFWSTVVFYVHRYVVRVKTYRWATVLLWVLSGLILGYVIFIGTRRENVFYARRMFSVKVVKTGFQFGWQHVQRPGLEK